MNTLTMWPISKMSTAGLLPRICLTLLAIGATWSPAQQLTGPPPPSRLPRDLPLHSALFDAEQEALGMAAPAAELGSRLKKRGLRMRNDEKVLVEIVGPPAAAGVEAPSIAPFGAEVSGRWRNYTEAWIPVRQLSKVARTIPLGYFLKPVRRPVYCDVAGEGPTVINSDGYRDEMANGAGLTIAIIDGGFDEFTEARANGDAPAPGRTVATDYTGRGFEALEDGHHGTGCVEAAFDHCPGAGWRLYKTDSITDFGNAVDDCIANGVHIISHSMSWMNTGWDDDSGPACTIANRASQNGILFFTSAGNDAEVHWQGDFSSGPDGDDWHDWSPNDETIRIRVPDGGTCGVYMSWDRSGGTYNYQLYLWDATQTNILASSLNAGNTYEDLEWTNDTGAAVEANISVWRAGGGTTEFEIFGTGDQEWLEHAVATGSTGSPSNATGARVISVGAVPHTSYQSPNGTTGIIMDYSSRGPSNSGMSLPDLCGPTNTTGFTYPAGFTGTSCATPNVTGATCAFWSADPLLRADAVRWLIGAQASAWHDWGDAGTDNIYGHGGPVLVDYMADTIWVSRSYGNTSNLRNAPFYSVQEAHNAAVEGGRLLFFPGGSYPEPATLTKNLFVETLVNATNLGF